jgi:hypothetical protein
MLVPEKWKKECNIPHVGVVKEWSGALDRGGERMKVAGEEKRRGEGEIDIIYFSLNYIIIIRWRRGLGFCWV